MAPLSGFPYAGLLPKVETQAESFIGRTKYNGKGIRVAVLDTGVDPATFGLGHCIVDLIDATSAGDVKLEEVEPLKEAPAHSSLSDVIYLQSPTGRVLAASKAWKNPSSKWKVSYKWAYELWPADLIKRRKEERSKQYDVQHSVLLAKAHQDLAAYEASNKKKQPKQESKPYVSKEGKVEKVEKPSLPSEDEEKRKESEKLIKKDLEDRIVALKELAKCEDAGPVLEVISWHDGEHYRAVLGGAEGEQEIIPLANQDGSSNILDLSKQKPMTDFKTERHYEHFGSQDLLSYSFNFYEDGEILSIVTLSGSHGSHVAGIIASDHKDKPELNGIAPGVEIVSIRIGDPRVSGMETHQALLRASKAIIDSGCHIANMSFGEDSAYGMERKGAFVEQIVQEVVRKRDIIFVTSAGNSGPALSTVGAPAAGDAVFSIGAYETPAMQAAMYAMLDKVPSSPYTWSSRGPTADGSVGVLCFAPGGAITGIPRYILSKQQLMNGTSMASPSACGAISLLLSALVAKKIPYTAARVKKAIEATSKDIGDPLQVGLLQIEKAYDYLLEHLDKADEDAEFEVKVTPTGRGEAMRGVYLREAHNTQSLQQFQVEVIPHFKVEETEKIYEFNLDISLKASESFVSVPAFVAMQGRGRLFSIQVDPTRLQVGLTTAQITGVTDSGRILFTIPVTVAKPEILSTPSYKFEHSFTSGLIRRHFVAVPEGATHAEVKITSAKHETPVQFWLHCVQVVPLKRLSEVEQSYVFSLANAGEPITRKFSVTPGVTLELCASQAWNALGRAEVEISVDFHGLHTGHDSLVLGEEEVRNLPVYGSVRPESLSPSMKFDTRRRLIRPKTSKITGLSSARNDLPSRKSLYQLLLSYDIKITKKSSVTPRFATSNHLYDGPFGILAAITDKNKRLVKWLDMYDKELADLDKGDYTLRLSIVHHDVMVLESQKNLLLALDTKLEGKANGLAFKFYRDRYDALTADKPASFTNVKVKPAEVRTIVVKASVPSEASADLYKDASAGDLLVGKYALIGDASKTGRQVLYSLPAKAAEEKKDEEQDEEKQSLVDLQIEMAKKIKDDKEKSSYLDTLVKENPKHLPLLVAKLESLKDEKNDSLNEDSVLRTADAILQLINVDELARANGLPKKSKDTAAERKAAKETNERKTALLLALKRKTKVLFDREAAPADHDETGTDDSYEAVSPQSSPTPYTDYASLMTLYRQWVETDTSDNGFALQFAKDHLKQKRFGSAIILLNKVLEDLGRGSGEKMALEARALRRSAIEKLEWDVVLERETKRKLADDPAAELIF